ncbi:MAG: trypsin-like peptidase domain-containing protein [Candidatus Eisenbacteria bacterium]|nr:trypsin-like peptidase domain-containing protein [Candidatus Eisenbacteria bacterium]
MDRDVWVSPGLLFLTALLILSFLRLSSCYAGNALSSLEEELESIVNNVKFCVVTVSSQYDVRATGSSSSPFERLGLRVDSHNNAVRQSVGSGIVFYREIIVTSGSVVKSGKEVKVVFENGQSYNATVLGTDRNANVCVLRVTGLKARPVTIGNSGSIRVGSLVVLMGNSFGKLPTVALGTVSGRQRVARIQGKWEIVQISGPLHPGNSGAAVLNTKGELVAMVVGKLVDDSGAGFNPGSGDVGQQIDAFSRGAGGGVGLAIPAEDVRRVVDGLLKNGYVENGYLGVRIQSYAAGGPITRIGLSSAPGIEIAEVISGSPAEKAGFKSGDIMSEFDNEAVFEAAQLSQMVSATRPGERVRVSFWRGPKRFTVAVTIGTTRASRDETPTGVRPRPSAPKADRRVLSTQ